MAKGYNRQEKPWRFTDGSVIRWRRRGVYSTLPGCCIQTNSSTPQKKPHPVRQASSRRKAANLRSFNLIIFLARYITPRGSWRRPPTIMRQLSEPNDGIDGHVQLSRCTLSQDAKTLSLRPVSPRTLWDRYFFPSKNVLHSRTLPSYTCRPTTRR